MRLEIASKETALQCAGEEFIASRILVEEVQEYRDGVHQVGWDQRAMMAADEILVFYQNALNSNEAYSRDLENQKDLLEAELANLVKARRLTREALEVHVARRNC